jgi:F420-dependent oxidoreductase-like protein
VREYLQVLRRLIHEGRVDFHGRVYNITTALQVPGAQPFPILISALAPAMLKIAGEFAEGTITWMAGRKAIETHIVPRIRAAAEEAGRPAPRVAVGVPVAVCDDEKAGRDKAARIFQVYGNLTNYRRILDVEGSNPGDVAVCGPEAAVEEQLRAFSAAGATDLLASIYPVGDSSEASIERSREFLRTLVGKL